MLAAGGGLAVLATGSALACDLALQGQAVQGGLVVGRAPIGASVEVAGNPVRVSSDGLFLAGFGRDAPQAVTISARRPGAADIECEIAVDPRTYKISRIDGLPSRKVTPNPADVARIRADNAAIGRVRKRDTPSADFAGGFIWPLKGRISGVFGSQRILNGKPRRPHNGVDVAAPKGSMIVAPAPGVVALVHADMFLTGKTVMLDHGHGLTSVYIHMSEIAVKENQRVEQGDAIGRVGMTGRATGPHLHWGVSLFRTHLDPALLAGPMKP